MTTTATEPTAADAWAALTRVAARPFAARRRFLDRLAAALPAARIPRGGPLPGVHVAWSFAVGHAGWAAAVCDAADATGDA